MCVRHGNPRGAGHEIGGQPWPELDAREAGHGRTQQLWGEGHARPQVLDGCELLRRQRDGRPRRPRVRAWPLLLRPHCEAGAWPRMHSRGLSPCHRHRLSSHTWSCRPREACTGRGPAGEGGESSSPCRASMLSIPRTLGSPAGCWAPTGNPAPGRGMTDGLAAPTGGTGWAGKPAPGRGITADAAGCGTRFQCHPGYQLSRSAQKSYGQIKALLA